MSTQTGLSSGITMQHVTKGRIARIIILQGFQRLDWFVY